MLLTQSQGSLLPVGHLLFFAHLIAVERLDQLRKTCRSFCRLDFLRVILKIDEIAEVLVEIHVYEASLEHS